MRAEEEKVCYEAMHMLVEASMKSVIFRSERQIDLIKLRYKIRFKYTGSK